jgi:exosortase F-associated protein
MSKKIKYTIIFLLFCCLVLVRAFENKLFYDPFIVFFENDYLYKKLPELQLTSLCLSLTFRYVLNTLVSLAILFFIFQKKSLLILSIKIYAIAFVLLLGVFVFLVNNQFENGYLLPFYVRRFLVHPLLLLLLIAVFKYDKMGLKTEN